MNSKLSGILESLGSMVRATDYKERTKTESSGPARNVITISREAGALGTTVARAAGKLLNWPVYDQELLDRIGKEMGTHVDVVKMIDEKPTNWVEECIVNLVSEYNLSHDTYMLHLIATVQALGEQGKCIIVGRGANFILPHETTLNVRLVGDLKDRVKYIQKKLNFTEKEAARWVDKTNKQRQEFVKHHFNRDVADLNLYDLGLNTSRLSVDECADIIVATLQRVQARKPAAQAK